MSPILYLIFFLISAGLAWFIYFEPLWHYAYGFSPYAIYTGMASMAFMFMSRVKLNEQGHVVFIGFSTNIICRAGTYWMPNALPFLQAIGFFAGCGIEQERTSSFGEVGGNPNITHRYDVGLNSHRVTHETASLFALNADRLIGLLGAFLFSFHDREGRFKYYKLGSILYVVAWILAFFGHAGNYASGALTSVNQTVQQGMSSFGLTTPSVNSGRVVRLDVGESPVIPSWKGFIPNPEEGPHYAKVRGSEKLYVFYSEPVSGDVGRVVVEEPLCSMVPKGRKILYWSKLPPTYASNVDDEVTYMRKKYGFRLWFESPLDDVMLEHTTGTWAYARDHWSEIDWKHYPLLTKAMESYELPVEEDGGLVCF
jgi:hypothetical protein